MGYKVITVCNNLIPRKKFTGDDEMYEAYLERLRRTTRNMLAMDCFKYICNNGDKCQLEIEETIVNEPKDQLCMTAKISGV